MTEGWVDFKQVKAMVTMQLLIDRYNLTGLKKTKDELRGKCPIHNGDGERSFHISLTKNAFNCFSCKARGNVLDLVAKMEHCSVRDAALKLAGWFNIEAGESVAGAVECSVVTGPVPDARDTTAATPTIINPPLAFELRVDPLHAYGRDRGLTEETLNEFSAGLCLSKGTFAGRFVFPVHNELGELVGYAGRSVDDTEPRYLFPSSERGFFKSHLLFNLHRVLEAQGDRRYKGVVVVEGFFDCLQVHQAGRACVALMGSSLSEYQAELLCQHFTYVTLLLDGDEAGRTGSARAVELLVQRCHVKAISLDDGQAPDSLELETIHRLLPRP